MADAIDASIAENIASVKVGSVVAAAGCGKTEQIAVATKLATGRRLILTSPKISWCRQLSISPRHHRRLVLALCRIISKEI
jgi:late competence protein required for DNA uptake (superfamily II DNA/RNA helicase)